MDANGGPFYGDLLRSRTDLQPEVVAVPGGHVKYDVILLNTLKPGDVDQNFVMADGKIRRGVITVVVGYILMDGTSLDACDRDLGIRNEGAGRIKYRADHRSLLSKCLGNGESQEKQQQGKLKRPATLFCEKAARSGCVRFISRRSPKSIHMSPT